MKRVFLDANILLEILFDRSLAGKCKSIVSKPENKYAISALTVHIVWYMAERYNLSTKLIDDLLSVWEVLGITSQDIRAARNRYDEEDFEDCLQAVCAEAGQCDEIVTIDNKFKQHSHTNLDVILIK